MAVPKKRKFLRNAIPKSVSRSLVCRRRNNNFRAQAVAFRQTSCVCPLNSLELVVLFNLYRLLPLLLRRFSLNAVGYRSAWSWPVSSIFLYRESSLFNCSSSLAIAGSSGVFLKQCVRVSVPTGIKALANISHFFTTKVVPTLQLIGNKPKVSEVAAVTQAQVASLLGAERPLEVRVGGLAAKKHNMPVGWLRFVSGKLKQVLHSPRLKWLRPTSGAVIVKASVLTRCYQSYLTWRSGLLASEKSSLSGDLYRKFFLCTLFHKKLQFKSVFKYYYWTWDPLWMRYRYRIYWAKKAMHKRLNGFIFNFFFKRLRAIQAKRVDVLSRWHCEAQGVYSLESLGERQKLSLQLFGLVYARTPLMRFFGCIEGVTSAIMYWAKKKISAKTKLGFVSVGVSLTLRRIMYLALQKPTRALGAARLRSGQVIASSGFSLRALWLGRSEPKAMTKLSAVTIWKKQANLRSLRMA